MRAQCSKVYSNSLDVPTQDSIKPAYSIFSQAYNFLEIQLQVRFVFIYSAISYQLTYLISIIN
jgi:hypothetical protein